MKLFSGVILITGTTFLMFSIFVVVFLGFLLGRITIKGVSLGAAGVFILALVYGALFSDHISETVSQTVSGKAIDISSNCLKIVENLGLIFFIGAVGHISGPTFFGNLKKNYKSYIISGLLIILSAALTCVACYYIGKKFENNSEEFVVMLVGLLSGSLTSTPAFSAAKATAETKYEAAVTVGHAISYLFGVIGVVLFVQLVPKVIGANMEEERALLEEGNGTVKKDQKHENHENHEHDHQSTEHNDEEIIENKEKENNENEKVDSNKRVSTEGALLPSNKNKKESNNLILSQNDIHKNEKESERPLKKENEKNEEEKDGKNEENEEKHEEHNDEPTFKLDPFGFCVFGFSAIVGIFFGAIRIPLSNKGLDGTTFSFTTTGGVLIICLIISHFGRICQLSLKIEKRVLEVLRELGLILFLTGSGISGGAKFVEYFKAIYFIYGIFMTLIPMFVGFFFSKYVLKLNLLNTLGSITGGMTSTPALGTLIAVSGTDDVAGSYAATYPVALISVVLCAQFIILLM